MQLDDLDLQIVGVLSVDGRASYSEISKAVGVSVGTVRNRITQMREAGVLHLNVWLDPYRSGLALYATLLLRVRAGHLETVTSRLAAIDEVGYVATLTGGHDVLADVFCRDVPHLSDLVHSEVQAIEGVESVTTYLVTDVKYESNLNIRRVIDKLQDGDGDQGEA